MKYSILFIFFLFTIIAKAQSELPPFNPPHGFIHQNNYATPSEWDNYIYYQGDITLQFWYAGIIDYVEAQDGTYTTKTRDNLIVNTGYSRSTKLYVYNVEDGQFSYHLYSKKNGKKFSDLSKWLLAEVRKRNLINR
jgi:hypothetical protein